MGNERVKGEGDEANAEFGVWNSEVEIAKRTAWSGGENIFCDENVSRAGNNV